MLQGKSLEEELSAHFCNAKADMKNLETTFILSREAMLHRKYTSLAQVLVLEIWIKEVDIGALFAFTITRNGSVQGKDNIATIKDACNTDAVLHYSYGQPFRLLHSEKRGFYLLDPANHLYLFGILAGSNQYEIYKAEVELSNETGHLRWQKIFQGRCYWRKGWIIIAEPQDYKNWPPLIELFDYPDFQKKLKPYIWTNQIPRWEDSEPKEEGFKRLLPRELL